MFQRINTNNFLLEISNKSLLIIFEKISDFEVSVSQSWRNFEPIKNLLFLLFTQVLANFSPKFEWTFWNEVEVVNNLFKNSSVIVRVQMSQINLIYSLLNSKPKLIVSDFVHFQGDNQRENFLQSPFVDC